MPDDVRHLTIRLRRYADGRVALTCTRADGTSTWQRQEGASARFFPYHDLTHFAVETELGLRDGFYGLVAAGWELTDFGAPWPRGRLPPEAAATELLVGLLDTERASGAEWSAEEFAEQAATHARSHAGPPAAMPNDTELRRIRARMRDLFARWEEVPPGGTLELAFAPGASDRSYAP